MNNQKTKIFNIICAILVISLFISQIAFAITGDVSLTASKTTVKAGDTFTVTIAAESNDGINGAVFKYSFDDTKLQLGEHGVTNNNWIELLSPDEVEIICDSTSHITSDDLYVLNFVVLDTVVGGEELTIGLTDITLDTDSNDSTGSEIHIDPKSIVITVERPAEPEHTHTWEMKKDDTYHWEQCTECNIIKENSKNAHAFPINDSTNDYMWVDNGDGTHSVTCNVCGYKLTNSHTFENGKCTGCNADEPVVEHVHTWEIKWDDDNHWKECTDCHEKQENSTGAHIYETWTDNGDGTHSSICEYSGCNKKATRAHNYEDGICVDCRAEEPTEPEEPEHTHTWEMKYDDTYHWEQCTVCRVIKENTKVKHDYGSWTDNGDGTHYRFCGTCGYIERSAHNYENGVCEDCGANEPTGPEEPEHTHTWEIKNDDTHHWEQCQYTECQVIKEDSKEAHVFGDYTDNEDGTHSRTCTVCNYKEIKAHTYEDGICTACGAEEPTEPEQHEHTWEVKYDDNNHWLQCKDCLVVKEGTKSAHTIGKITDNGDGTHSIACGYPGCKHVSIKAHNFVDGVCVDCKAKQPNVPVDGKEDGKDDTTAKDDIPNTGAIPVLSVTSLIAAIGVVSVITFVINKNNDIL